MKKTAAAIVLALTFALAACMPLSLAVPEEETDSSALGCEASKWGCDDPVESSPTPAAPERGTLDNPLPQGYVATISSDSEDLYSFSAKLVSGDADKAIKKKNQFNDPPPAGMKYILVDYTFTGLSDAEPVDPAYESRANFVIATPDGRVFPRAVAVLPGNNDLDDSPELYKGQSYTGREAYLVPADSTSWLVTTLGSYILL